MLICKLEMQPEGILQNAYTVGEIRISQVSGDCFVANYEIEIDKAARTARTPGVWRTAAISHFDHCELGPYDLLLRGLIACLGGRSHAAVAGISPARVIFHQTDFPETEAEHKPA